MKAEHPTDLLTVENLAAVYVIYEAGDEQLADSDTDWVQWAEHGADGMDDAALFVVKEATGIERHFAMSAVFHKIGAFYQDTDPRCLFVDASETTQNSFDGIRIDTCADRTSVLSIEQFQAYCRTSNRSRSLNPSYDRVIRGIDGGCKSIKLVVIQDLFEKLDLILDVQLWS